MRSLWIRFRTPLAIIALFIIALAMARIFSGPEDAWIKNEQGEWVMHGQPAGPPPVGYYQEPLAHLVLPPAFLIAFAVPLFFIGKHKPHNRLNFDTAARDIKLYGYLSTAFFLFGILTIAGLMFELAVSMTGERISPSVESDILLFVVSLAGFAGLCIVLSIQFFTLKRNAGDHYQLERGYREITESLGKLSSG